MKGETYYDLSVQSDFDGLVRRIYDERRKRHPRRGAFISYSHKDEPKWLDSLLTHIAFVKQSGAQVWTDHDIDVGDLWHDTIQTALWRARIAILLVTPNFLNSSYILSQELPNMLKAAKTDGSTIFWIPVKPSSVAETEISQFQAAHPPAHPLSGLHGAKRDEAFVRIAAELSKSLDSAKGTGP